MARSFLSTEERRLESPGKFADYESTPLARSEYITALVHLYRGELYRATTWRMRLDNTTNWAVLTTAGLLTFAFGEGTSASHWILPIGMALVTVFLGFEARRFRLADVWYARLRKIEENFYGPILRRDLASPIEGWGALVAEDLFQPRFKISRLAAMRARFVRNYWPIYVVILFAWVVKLIGTPTPAHTWHEVQERLGSGLIAWWAPMVYMACFVAGILVLLASPRLPHSERERWGTGSGEGHGREPLDI